MQVIVVAKGRPRQKRRCNLQQALLVFLEVFAAPGVEYAFCQLVNDADVQLVSRPNYDQCLFLPESKQDGLIVQMALASTTFTAHHAESGQRVRRANPAELTYWLFVNARKMNKDVTWVTRYQHLSPTKWVEVIMQVMTKGQAVSTAVRT